MLRAIGLFLLLATLVLEQVPFRGIGQGVTCSSDMVDDTDDAPSGSEDFAKDGKDPLAPGHWASPHPVLMIAGEEAAEVHHLEPEPDPIHFEVPTPPPLS